MEAATKILREKGLKATAQRVMVYKALARLGHATVDEVAEAVGAEAPSVSVATVYKALDSLAEAGVAARLSTPEGKLCYDTTPTPHPHLLLPDGTVSDYPDAGLMQLIADYLAAHPVPGMEVERMQLQLFCK